MRPEIIVVACRVSSRVAFGGETPFALSLCNKRDCSPQIYWCGEVQVFEKNVILKKEMNQRSLIFFYQTFLV